MANGEIYNHKELRAELGIPNEELITDSDSEIIIHGYRKLGNEICNKLIGMFGFVLITESGDVLACRDKVRIFPTLENCWFESVWEQQQEFFITYTLAEMYICRETSDMPDADMY